MELERVREYQLAQLPLIKEVDKICNELGLKYYLIGGTLLGSVRDNGFIPWDPDMDIALPRKDYEALRAYFTENNDEKFFYQHYETEKNHLSPHALLRMKGTHVIYKSRATTLTNKYDGLFLDIFPLDEPPADKKTQEKQMKKIKKIKHIIELKAAYTYDQTSKLKFAVKKIVQFLLKPISITSLQRKLDNVMQRYNDGTSDYYVSMASHYSYFKQLMPKSVYGEPKRVTYENMQLCAPEQTEDYLTRIFGDYMKLPPENKRYKELDSIKDFKLTTESV